MRSKKKKKKKVLSSLCIFPPSIFNSQPSLFAISFFSSQFSPLFPCLFFPVGQHKFPGQKSLGGTLLPHLLCHCISEVYSMINKVWYCETLKFFAWVGRGFENRLYLVKTLLISKKKKPTTTTTAHGPSITNHDFSFGLKKSNCLVVLHNFFFEKGRVGRFFFFF